MTAPQQITLQQWEERYGELKKQGLKERFYGGPLSRHVKEGDTRLEHLKFDNSPAALALWNLLLSESQRLHQARSRGITIAGAMKDLGTIPVIACSFDAVLAFYPDGTWWTPCIMEQNEGLLQLADKYGLDDSLCPVRAMFAAFLNEQHFPRPDVLICSTGAVCDDFSAVAQCLEQQGFPIHWWEIVHRRRPEPAEPSIQLPGGLCAPESQVDFTRRQLCRITSVLEATAGCTLTEAMLREGIRKANQFRLLLGRIRDLTYGAAACPMGALEMLIAEMLAIHFCSGYNEALEVLQALHTEIQRRIRNNLTLFNGEAARIFWVNPVADLRAMNLLEQCGGRVCGTEYLFSHTLQLIPEDIEPMEALARTALADPMTGSTEDRARWIKKEIERYNAEGMIISRIPGASHCAFEGPLIGEYVRKETGIPVAEIEVPSLCDAVEPSLRTRIEALIETIRERRRP